MRDIRRREIGSIGTPPTAPVARPAGASEEQRQAAERIVANWRVNFSGEDDALVNMIDANLRTAEARGVTRGRAEMAAKVEAVTRAMEIWPVVRSDWAAELIRAVLTDEAR